MSALAAQIKAQLAATLGQGSNHTASLSNALRLLSEWRSSLIIRALHLALWAFSSRRWPSEDKMQTLARAYIPWRSSSIDRRNIGVRCPHE
jgi:hypothetical protein